MDGGGWGEEDSGVKEVRQEQKERERRGLMEDEFRWRERKGVERYFTERKEGLESVAVL